MKYARAKIKTPPTHPELHQHGVVDGNFLSHVAKQVGGRKQLAYILRVSESLIDQRISGAKADPMRQCKKMMRALVEHGRPDFAFAIVEDVASEIKAVVFTAEQFRALGVLARTITK